MHQGPPEPPGSSAISMNHAQMIMIDACSHNAHGRDWRYARLGSRPPYPRPAHVRFGTYPNQQM